MEENKQHISSYASLAKVLIALLALTTLTIFVTSFDLKAWNITLALLIATTKVIIVATYFMHLKYEQLMFKLFTVMVGLLFIVVLLLTFVDYSFR